MGDFLTSNTILFKLLLRLSDQTEILKNYTKLKYKASKKFKKSFISTTEEDTLFFRMLTIDRGYWTFDNNEYSKIQPGLKKADYFLKNLYELFNENNIQSYLIIYPWPAQIFYGDEKHKNYWQNFSKENGINFINLYDQFESSDKRKFILDNFIFGDIHWNKVGTIKILNGLNEKGVFSEINSIQ